MAKNFVFLYKLSLISMVVTGSFFIKLSLDQEKQNIKKKTSIVVQQVEKSITYNTDYLKYQLFYASRQVRNIKSNSTAEKQKKIANILSSFLGNVNNQVDIYIAWNAFSWIDSNNKLVVDGTDGIIKNPSDLSDRDYLKVTSKSPDILVFGETVTGAISGRRIIPVAMGVFSDKNVYLGTLVFGFDLDRILSKLEKTIGNEDFDFVVLHNDNVVLCSSTIDESDFQFAQELNYNSTKDNALNAGKLVRSQSILSKDSGFAYLQVGGNTPLKIVGFYDKDKSYQEMMSLLLKQSLFILLLLISISVLFQKIYKEIVKPIYSLSKLAQKLVDKDFSDFDIEKPSKQELVYLYNALDMVKDFLKQEEEIKNNLEIGKKDAEDANHNKTEFLASTAHELKNMLSGIIGLGELAKYNIQEKHFEDKKQYEESIGWIADMVKLGEESSEFVNDILDINQAQTGDFRIDTISEVDLKSIMIRSINLMKIRAIREQKNIVSNIAKDDSKKFLTYDLDPRRVKQIFVNIISNAIKYSMSGKNINISLSKLNKKESQDINLNTLSELNKSYLLHQDKKDLIRNNIQKKIDNNDDRILIEISDEGIGMSYEGLEISQTKYGTIHNNALKNKKIDSTGLGLPIVKHLIEEQGGIFKIESKRNNGTKVSIIF